MAKTAGALSSGAKQRFKTPLEVDSAGRKAKSPPAASAGYGAGIAAGVCAIGHPAQIAV